MSSLQDYLAKNYLSKKEQKRLKKQKRKESEIKVEASTSTSIDETQKDLIPNDSTRNETEADIEGAVVIDSTSSIPSATINIKKKDAIDPINDPLSVFKPSETRVAAKYSENRFKIKAGPHWDGINRSNGYEQKKLTKQKESEYQVHNRDYYDDDIYDHYSDE